jgi:hypothetical protein
MTVDAAPAKDFGGAVDKAQASGEVSKGIAGLQITQAKAMLIALATSGALGEGTIGASVSGHGESPASFTITVQEFVDVPVAPEVDDEAAEEAAEAEPVPTPVPVAPLPVAETPAEPPGQPAPGQ